MGTPVELVDKKQIQLIKIAQKQIGMDDDTYREMLVNNFKKKSCTQLTRAQGALLIKMMQKKGFKLKKGAVKWAGNPLEDKQQERKPMPRQFGNVTQLASPDEHKKIAALSKLIQWRVKDGLTRWLFARFSIERVKTAREAYLAIEGLKAMFENQMKAAYGKSWEQATYDDPEIMEYIERHKSVWGSIRRQGE